MQTFQELHKKEKNKKSINLVMSFTPSMSVLKRHHVQWHFPVGVLQSTDVPQRLLNVLKMFPLNLNTVVQ